jgi:hypothetical protein
MTTFTLVIVLMMGYDFDKSPSAVSISNVPGFTTEQACINAGNKVMKSLPSGFRYTERKASFTCVVDTI